jgi:orotidine-5'-phosphate decarboxylase
MFIEKLKLAAEKNKTRLCVGLDFDPAKVPDEFKGDPLGYNKRIIAATQDLVCAYKPNTAFYEVLGRAGLDALAATVRAVPAHVPVILDAKRGDIGNTSRMYARAAYEHFGADAVTVSPYMGTDSIGPFLEFKDRGVFVLCLTSNPGAADFQKMRNESGPLYYQVARKCNEWAETLNPNIGLVVGATNEELADLRKVTALPFLVPGIGAQGGDLRTAVCEGNRGGLGVINVSRSVIYPKGDGPLDERVRAEAERLHNEIARFLESA